MFAAENKQKGYNKNHHLKNPHDEHVGVYSFSLSPQTREIHQ